MHTNDNIIRKSLPLVLFFFIYVSLACYIKAQVDIERKKNYKGIRNIKKNEMRHQRLDLTKRKTKKKRYRISLLSFFVLISIIVIIIINDDVSI